MKPFAASAATLELNPWTLVRLPASTAAHLASPIRAAASGVGLEMPPPADLEAANLANGRLLIVRDRAAGDDLEGVANDEERRRLLDLTAALERRLGTAEEDIRSAGAEVADKLARADARAARLERRIASLEAGAGTGAEAAAGGDGEEKRIKAEEDARRRRQYALELAFQRDQRIQQDLALAELRQTCADQEQELRRLRAEQADAGDLAARLQASERVRASQTEALLAYQRRIQEVEQCLTTLAAMLQADEGTDPEVLLRELAGRLAQVESARSDQQGTIDQLSRNLAVQQIDDTLDDAQSRRDVVARVDEAVQRSRRLGLPLMCLMVGIDNPMGLRSEHGSIAYDFMLVQIAQRLHLTLRRGDVVMRYGDGDFVLITDAKSAVAARSHAERLIREVCSAPLELGDRQLEIGISIAILPYDDDIDGAYELLRRAKGTLLEAQARGSRQILVGTANPAPAGGRRSRSGPRHVPFS